MERSSGVDRSVGVTRAGAVEPSQSFTTEGLEPTMVRPGRVTRFFMAVVAFAERLNLKYSKVGNPPVYDAATFPWVAEIEREWPAMRAELDRVLERQAELPSFQTIATDVKTITKDDHWKTFFLVGFGVRSERNIARCPETWRIVRKVPGLKTAMFSIFEPGKHLPAHRGPYNGVLRLHLALMVPPHGPHELAIRVGDRICHWQEGKALVFDDAYEHEAWNHTARHSRGAVRRLREALALSGKPRELAAHEPRRVHALHPRGARRAQGMGEALL